MKGWLVLAIVIGAGLARWLFGPAWVDEVAPRRDVPAAAAAVDSDDCRGSDEAGDEAAAAVNAVGARSKWMTNFARDVGRRSYSAAKHRACPNKD